MKKICQFFRLGAEYYTRRAENIWMIKRLEGDITYRTVNLQTRNGTFTTRLPKMIVAAMRRSRKFCQRATLICFFFHFSFFRGARL